MLPCPISISHSHSFFRLPSRLGKFSEVTKPDMHADLPQTVKAKANNTVNFPIDFILRYI